MRLLLLAGTLGTGLAVVVGALAARAVPFVITAATIVLPLLALLGFGLVGALAAVRRIASVDPLIALGATR